MIYATSDLHGYPLSDFQRLLDKAHFSDSDFLFERLKTYRQTMAEPFVSGKDLVEAGLRPGEEFSELLEYAHKLRLAGIDKQAALKQVLSYKGKKK